MLKNSDNRKGLIYYKKHHYDFKIISQLHFIESLYLCIYSHNDLLALNETYASMWRMQQTPHNSTLEPELLAEEQILTINDTGSSTSDQEESGSTSNHETNASIYDNIPKVEEPPEKHRGTDDKPFCSLFKPELDRSQSADELRRNWPKQCDKLKEPMNHSVNFRLTDVCDAYEPYASEENGKNEENNNDETDSEKG